MKGWKTWVAIAGLVCMSVIDFTNGDIEAGMTKLTSALAAYGIGHKVEKSGY